jgi:hypothetical protein
MKGLRAYIYKDSMGDSSNHGISSRCKVVVVVGAGIPEIFEPSENEPAVKLVHRSICGGYVHAEPLEWRESDDITGIFGGCFIYSSDSRFREKISKYPVPLHDRGETQEMYDRLSV